MQKCPHCSEPGVSIWAKYKAGGANPAICRCCGKPSSIDGAILGILGGVFHMLFLGSALAAFYYWAWWPLIVFLTIYILSESFMVTCFPLKAMTGLQVKKERKFFYIFMIAFAFAMLIAGLFF